MVMAGSGVPARSSTRTTRNLVRLGAHQRVVSAAISAGPGVTKPSTGRFLVRRTSVFLIAATIVAGSFTAAMANPLGYGDCVGVSDVTVGPGGAHIGEAYADPGSCV
jgi:hypothetical protein